VALKLESKKEIVAEVSAVASTSVSAVVAHYRGLSVAEMTELRANARKSGIYLRVVRNTLARIAVKDTDFACITEALTGPVVLAFSRTEPSAAARLMRDFVKGHDKLEVKAIAVSGVVYAGHQLEAIALLPTKDEAISQLMSVMKAPVTQLVRTINEPTSKFVRTFAALRDQKQAA
jgi:large subunit ribosomal protein L10